MEEHKTRSEGSKARSMEDLLEQREKLDRLLHDEFRKEVTLLFTDICGYT